MTAPGHWQLRHPIDLQVQGPGVCIEFGPRGRVDDAPWVLPRTGSILRGGSSWLHYLFFFREFDPSRRQRAMWRQFGDCSHLSGTHVGW